MNVEYKGKEPHTRSKNLLLDREEEKEEKKEEEWQW
jgi:hypothetical protein